METKQKQFSTGKIFIVFSVLPYHWSHCKTWLASPLSSFVLAGDHSNTSSSGLSSPFCFGFHQKICPAASSSSIGDHFALIFVFIFWHILIKKFWNFHVSNRRPRGSTPDRQRTLWFCFHRCLAFLQQPADICTDTLNLDLNLDICTDTLNLGWLWVEASNSSDFSDVWSERQGGMTWPTKM